MNVDSFKVADDLYLVRTTWHPSASPMSFKLEQPVNHIAVIDCSGSMTGDLPNIREQLKSRIPKILSQNDTLSIVWFSGANQHGVLLKAEHVATLVDLQDVNKAIDRWLQPIGLTGFVGPLADVEQMIAEVKTTNRNPFALFFMSDGHDNQCNRQDIFQVVQRVGKDLASVTVVEYGYYADRPLLTQMATRAGGTLIFSEDFKRYAPAFESALTRKVMGQPKVAVPVHADAIGGFVFSMDSGELYTFEVENQDGVVAAFVTADMRAMWYLANTPQGKSMDTLEVASRVSHQEKAPHVAVDAAYAAVSLFSQRMQSNIVFPLLRSLGDVDFIKQFGSCFGKQAYSAFMDRAKEAAFGLVRWEAGFDPSCVPDNNAFTVLDLLTALDSDDKNRVLLDHEDFKYSRISRGRERAEDSELSFSAKKVRRGYSVSSLTFNEKRPNISFLIHREGEVDLLGTRPKDLVSDVPKRFKTKVWRNYAVVKDGLVNIAKLPVSLSLDTWHLLKAHRIVEQDTHKPAVNVIDLTKLPILNRSMVNQLSAQVMFDLQLGLTWAKAQQKVYGSYLKELFPNHRLETLAKQYGDDGARFLKEQGITDHGFSPKMKTTEVRDYYLGKELTVSLKGLMSLSKVEDVRKRLADKKDLTPSMKLMETTISEVEEYKANHTIDELKDWLQGRKKFTTAYCRKLAMNMAKIRITVIVGQTWFKEFASLDENTLTIQDKTLGEIKCTVEMKEVKISL